MLSHDEQIAFYRAHPPSCLDGLKVTSIESLDFVFDGHGSPINSIFELACPCGSRSFWLECYVDPDGDDVNTPISIQCEADDCDAGERVIYDRNKHGYDGRAGDLPVEHGPDAYQTDIGEPYGIIVRFEYSVDALGEHPGEDHEMFSWITIVIRHPETGQLGLMFHDECA